MSDDMHHEGAENPEELTGLKKGKLKKAAAGFEAVVSGSKMMFKEAGIARGLKAMRHLNKRHGFDCPSCAWPDPDDERSRIAEYCENGAKAVGGGSNDKKIDCGVLCKKLCEGSRFFKRS
jgi:anaerobic selenocysteine-containing dehydrogenase